MRSQWWVLVGWMILGCGAPVGEDAGPGGDGAPDAGPPQTDADVSGDAGLLAIGDACVAATTCASGFCAQGVCCESECGGACEACAAAATGLANGVCGPVQATTQRRCRPATGACDVAEVCDGTSAECPADSARAAGAVCRPEAGACDIAEVCDGTSAECPPDGLAAAGLECRAAGGACDAADLCDGTHAACPEDRGPLRVVATSREPLCAGDDNASAEVAPSGGTAPYTHLWTDGQTSAAAVGLSAGAHSVTTTDAAGCSIETPFVLADPPPLTVSLSTAPDACPADAGAVDATVAGGRTPYTYEWSHGPTTEDVSGLRFGSYELEVTDSSGCSLTREVTVSNDAPLPSCTIEPGRFRTETTDSWERSAGAAYLSANFADAFPTGLTVGCNNVLLFTNAASIGAYLPCEGSVHRLTVSLVNPTICLNSSLASEAIALELSLGFDAHDPAFCASAIPLGDLRVRSGALAGLTVSEVSAEANRLLGFCPSPYSGADLVTTLRSINESFRGGTEDRGALGCPICSM